jgi:hypothetical protein
MQVASYALIHPRPLFEEKASYHRFSSAFIYGLKSSSRKLSTVATRQTFEDEDEDERRCEGDGVSLFEKRTISSSLSFHDAKVDRRFDFKSCISSANLLIVSAPQMRASKQVGSIKDFSL